jgi:hypothetical protein
MRAGLSLSMPSARRDEAAALLSRAMTPLVAQGKKRRLVRLYCYADLTETDDMRLEWAAPTSWVMRA